MQFRQKRCRAAERGIIGGVALHHNAVSWLHAVIRKQAVQIFQDTVLPGGTCNYQQLAAVHHIVRQQTAFVLGQIAFWCINHQAVRILRNGLCIQQRQAFNLNVILFHLLLEGAGQVSLTVTFDEVEFRLFTVHHIVNGGGDGSLTVKGSGVGIGVHIRILDVNVVIADIAAAVAALYDQTVVGNAFTGVLLGKGGIDIRILFHHFDMV